MWGLMVLCVTLGLIALRLYVSQLPAEKTNSSSPIEDTTKSNKPPLVSKFKTEYQWKRITVEGSSELNVSQGVPFDFERTIDGRTFITLVPKNKFPISLTTISGKKSEDGPLLTPYPDSTWFLNPLNCSNITGAWSIKIDKCNRLWVLDTGHYKNLQVCNPKLLVFNLTNDKLLNKYEIPQELYLTKPQNNILINPIVETDDSSCNVKSVYMADSQGYGLVIWNGTEFRHLGGFKFQPESASKDFNISGTTLFFPGGTVPLVLNPNSQTLALALLAPYNSLTFNKTELETISRRNPKLNDEIDRLEGQPSSFRFSTDGKILFMGLIDNTIRCWRVEEKFDAQNMDTAIVDSERLQFLRSIKIYSSRENQDDDEIWVLMDSSQKTTNKKRDFDKINYKILHVSMRDLIKDTHCK